MKFIPSIKFYYYWNHLHLAFPSYKTNKPQRLYLVYRNIMQHITPNRINSHICNMYFHENRLAFKIMLKYANWIQDLTKMQIIIFEILFLTQRKKLSFFTGFNGSSFFSYFTRIICFDANMFAVQSTYLDLIQMNLHNRLKYLFLRINSFICCFGKNYL